MLNHNGSILGTNEVEFVLGVVQLESFLRIASALFLKLNRFAWIMYPDYARVVNCDQSFSVVPDGCLDRRVEVWLEPATLLHDGHHAELLVVLQELAEVVAAAVEAVHHGVVAVCTDACSHW